MNNLYISCYIAVFVLCCPLGSFGVVRIRTKDNVLDLFFRGGYLNIRAVIDFVRSAGIGSVCDRHGVGAIGHVFNIGKIKAVSAINLNRNAHPRRIVSIHILWRQSNYVVRQRLIAFAVRDDGCVARNGDGLFGSVIHFGGCRTARQKENCHRNDCQNYYRTRDDASQKRFVFR